MTDPITDKLVDNIGAARGTDYFLMKEQLTQEEAEILKRVREFGEKEVLLGNALNTPSSSSPRLRR